MRSIKLLTFLIMTLIFLFSCKGKPESDNKIEVHNHPNPHPGGLTSHDSMAHSYGMYNKKILISERPTHQREEMFGYIKIGGVEYKYFKSILNSNYFLLNKKRKFYIVDDSSSYKMVTPINPILKNNVDLDSLSFVDSFSLMAAKGDYGCIPRFEMNLQGHLLYSEDPGNGNNKIVPIIVAVHDPNNMNDIIEELTLKQFKMTSENYELLDNLFTQNIYLDAGLDPIVGTNPQKLRLKAYPIGGDTLVIDEQ